MPNNPENQSKPLSQAQIPNEQNNVKQNTEYSKNDTKLKLSNILWMILLVAIVGSAIFIGASLFSSISKNKKDADTSQSDGKKTVSTYEECAALNNAKITKDPNQCTTSEGKMFTELIKVSAPENSQTVVAKKFVKSIPNGSSAVGVNVREEPCQKIVGNLQKWDSSGEIIGQNVQKECLGAKYTWIQVSWTDGTKGWSISDNLEISDTPIRSVSSKMGNISGSLVYPSDFIPNQKLCAKEISASLETCIDTKGSTYTISVSPGVYNVYVKGILDKDGKLQNWQNLVHYNKYVKDCMMEGYPGEKCKGNNVPSNFHTEIINVKVEAGKNVENVNPWDWYA